MQTVEAPAAMGLQAMAVIRRHWAAVGIETPIRQAGVETLAEILCDLERRFGVLIEVDEVWSGLTAADLAALVAIKVGDRCRRDLLPANDVVYLPPTLPPHPQDRAHAVRRTLRLIRCGLAISLTAGGLAAMAYGASAFLP